MILGEVDIPLFASWASPSSVWGRWRPHTEIGLELGKQRKELAKGGDGSQLWKVPDRQKMWMRPHATRETTIISESSERIMSISKYALNMLYLHATPLSDFCCVVKKRCVTQFFQIIINTLLLILYFFLSVKANKKSKRLFCLHILWILKWYKGKSNGTIKVLM